MNDDLISRSSIAAEVKNLSSSPLNEWDTLGVLELIYRQPAVDPHKHGRWISVKDRLPEADTPVLVTYLGYTDGIARTDGIGTIRWGVWCWYESEDHDNDEEITVRITHWMPLPEPPEEEAHTNGRFDR